MGNEIEWDPSAWLKEWRTALGWTQAKAAQELGVSLSTYSRYERYETPLVVILAAKYLSGQEGYVMVKAKYDSSLMKQVKELERKAEIIDKILDVARNADTSHWIASLRSMLYDAGYNSHEVCEILGETLEQKPTVTVL